MVVMDGLGLFLIINWRLCIPVAVQKEVQILQVILRLIYYESNFHFCERMY